MFVNSSPESMNQVTLAGGKPPDVRHLSVASVSAIILGGKSGSNTTSDIPTGN
ncbi:hypothetical protein DPMN_057236 [Dreissena polymorpha]|uniref:Uncharacterized protein n=1 Tax=Dreissena polymorpha TaxID=45954 RepID=A0A9D4CVW3_DREPO|nr:hypothetical protein DPMN_057236 [Dreissena polymorpha]